MDGIDLTIRAGRGPRPRRRVGLGQDDDRPGHRQAHRQTGGHDRRSTASDVSTLWGTKALRDYRRRVQLIFQDPYETLNPKHTIREFVAEPLIVNDIGTTRASATRTVIAALEAAGLRPAADFAFRYPHELSGGQRQRVVIAGALVMDPELIVADEPVSMLDVSIRTELLRLMLDLRRERGLTYLFITHDLSLAWVIADRIAVMYLGRIMEIGPGRAGHPRRRATRTRRRSSRSAPSPDPPDGGRARRADDPRRRDAGRGARSRPAAGSTPAARSRSTDAGSRSRRCSTSARATRRPAGWPRPGPRDLPIIDAIPHDPTVTPLAEAADSDEPEPEAAPAG